MNFSTIHNQNRILNNNSDSKYSIISDPLRCQIHVKLSFYVKFDEFTYNSTEIRRIFGIKEAKITYAGHAIIYINIL